MAISIMAKDLISSNVHREITLPVLIILSVIAIYVVAGANDLQAIIKAETITSTTERFFDDVYIKIGFISIFLYELVPTVFRLLSTTGFYIGLLNEGINPMILVIVASIGRIFGFYLLYLLGRFLYRIFKKKDRELADADHLLHKYSMIVFFLVPYFGVLGDIIIIVAGHQRIGFLKMIPMLFLSTVLRNAIWIYLTIAQIQVVNA